MASRIASVLTRGLLFWPWLSPLLMPVQIVALNAPRVARGHARVQVVELSTFPGLYISNTAKARFAANDKRQTTNGPERLIEAKRLQPPKTLILLD